QPFEGQRMRNGDIEVDPVAQRAWPILLLEPDRRVPSHRIHEVVVAEAFVPERGVPERQTFTAYAVVWGRPRDVLAHFARSDDA
ncbi:MAG TPA: hypothetical protein VFZ37_16780, partial [Jiangellaceae bacterium]